MRFAQLILACAGVLALASSGSAQAPPADSGDVREVRRLLDPRQRSLRSSSELVRDLVACGPRVAPVLVGMLTGALPGADWEESGLTLEESRAAQSDEDALLREALRGLPAAPVARALSQACGGEAALDRRLVGLHLLADVGEGADAVACWHELCRGIDEIHFKRAYVRAQLETALARCLERSPGGFEPLARAARKWDAKLLPAVVHACTQAGRREGVELLSGLRGGGRELDLELLANLPALAQATTGSLDEAQLAWLRGFLGDADPGVRTTAVLALGRVCDPGCAAALIETLGDEDERVGQAALWSLESISHQQLSGSRTGWESWLGSEERWSVGARARCLRALESESAASVVEALQELCTHPLFRHESALSITALLEREEPEVLRAACAALQQLDSMAAAVPLAAVLARPEADVRQAAHAALVAISGRTLPPELSVWQLLLGG